LKSTFDIVLNDRKEPRSDFTGFYKNKKRVISRPDWNIPYQQHLPKSIHCPGRFHSFSHQHSTPNKKNNIRDVSYTQGSHRKTL